MFATPLLLLMLLAPPQVQDKAPALSEMQKLQIQNAVQKIEITQLRFEAARGDLMALLNGLKIPGYTLDLSTLTYKKDAPPAPEGKPEGVKK